MTHDYCYCPMDYFMQEGVGFDDKRFRNVDVDGFSGAEAVKVFPVVN